MGPPERAKAALQTHLSDLRRQLPVGLIVTEGYGYRLELGEHDLDAVAVAVSLWRGSPYDELADDSFARPEIARLEECHVELPRGRPDMESPSDIVEGLTSVTDIGFGPDDLRYVVEMDANGWSPLWARWNRPVGP